MNPKIAFTRISLLPLLFALCAVTALAQTTSFTYQGRLTDGGTPASGNYDLQFALFDTVSGGAQIGAPQKVPNVAVSAGIFTVPLDFGANAFPGGPRFLEIGVRPAGHGAFTILSPRQPITSTPYAIRSLNASSADAVTVSGVPGGSANYIQNQMTETQTGNFDISGSGTIGSVLAANKVSIGTQLTAYKFQVFGTNLPPGACAPAIIGWGADVGGSCTTALHLTTDAPAKDFMNASSSPLGDVFRETYRVDHSCTDSFRPAHTCLDLLINPRLMLKENL